MPICDILGHKSAYAAIPPCIHTYTHIRIYTHTYIQTDMHKSLFEGARKLGAYRPCSTFPLGLFLGCGFTALGAWLSSWTL